MSKATKASRPQRSMPSRQIQRKPDNISQDTCSRLIKGEALSSWYQTTLRIADKRLGRHETARAILHAAAPRHSRCRETDSRGVAVRQVCGGRVVLRVTTGLAAKWTGKTPRSCVDAFRVLSDTFGWFVEIGTPSQLASNRTPSVIWIELADSAGEDLTFQGAARRADQAKAQARRDKSHSGPRKSFVGEAPLETSSLPETRSPSGGTTSTAPSSEAPGGVVSSQEEDCLTPDQRSVEQALVKVGLGERGAKSATAALPAEAASALVASGADYLASVLASLEGKVDSPKGVLVQRFRKPELRRELVRGARDWVRAHPGATLVSALAEWRHLQSTEPSLESAGYLTRHDQTQKALSAVVALAEQALGNRVDPLREQLRAVLVGRGLREDSLSWKRAWHIRWRLIVFQEAGLDTNDLRGDAVCCEDLDGSLSRLQGFSRTHEDPGLAMVG